LGHHVAVDGILDGPDGLAARGVGRAGDVVDGLAPLVDGRAGFVEVGVGLGEFLAGRLEVVVDGLALLLAGAGVDAGAVPRSVDGERLPNGGRFEALIPPSRIRSNAFEGS